METNAFIYPGKFYPEYDIEMGGIDMSLIHVRFAERRDNRLVTYYEEGEPPTPNYLFLRHLWETFAINGKKAIIKYGSLFYVLKVVRENHAIGYFLYQIRPGSAVIIPQN